MAKGPHGSAFSISFHSAPSPPKQFFLLLVCTVTSDSSSDSPYTYGVAVALYTGLLTFPGNFRFMSVMCSTCIVFIDALRLLDILTPPKCEAGLEQCPQGPVARGST